MNILNKIPSFADNANPENMTEGDIIIKKSLVGIVIAIGIFIVSAIGIPNTANADDENANVRKPCTGANVICFTLEMNTKTGEVINVLREGGKVAVKHGSGIPGYHGEHEGVPIETNIQVIQGLKGVREEMARCPDGLTHIIIAGIHYCF